MCVVVWWCSSWYVEACALFALALQSGWPKDIWQLESIVVAQEPRVEHGGRFRLCVFPFRVCRHGTCAAASSCFYVARVPVCPICRVRSALDVCLLSCFFCFTLGVPSRVTQEKLDNKSPLTIFSLFLGRSAACWLFARPGTGRNLFVHLCFLSACQCALFQHRFFPQKIPPRKIRHRGAGATVAAAAASGTSAAGLGTYEMIMGAALKTRRYDDVLAQADAARAALREAAASSSPLSAFDDDDDDGSSGRTGA